MLKSIVILLTCIPLMLTLAKAEEMEFYIGTFTNGDPGTGIFRSTFNTETGELGPITVAVEESRPNYLAFSPDGQYLYAVARSDGEHAVNAYKRNADGTLTLINSQPSGGDGPCHITLDPSGKVAFVANYSDGSAASFPIQKDGSLGEVASFYKFEGSGPNPKRQKAPHGHAAVPSPDGRFAHIVDLGTDKVWIFEVDAESGKMTPAAQPSASVPPGGGARHCAISDDGEFLYVNNEMGLSTSVFDRDPETGAMELVETVPVHLEPPTQDRLSTAAIMIHPNGKWLYVTSRRDDLIAVYEIDAEKGTLNLVQNAPAEVEIPRDAEIDPTGKWMLTAGQNNDTIAVLAINQQTGKLSSTGISAAAQKPVCLMFTPTK